MNNQKPMTNAQAPLSLQRKKQPAISPTVQLSSKEHKIKRQEISSFFRALQLDYQPKIRFSEECRAFSRVCEDDFVDYCQQPAYYDSLRRDYGCLIERGIVAPTYIQWVDKKIGYGLFAASSIGAASMIGQYTGELRKRSVLISSSWSWGYPSHSFFKPHLPSDTIVTAHEVANELRFVNHGEQPNSKCVMVFSQGVWHLLYIATRDIHKDEEITISYGKRHWRHRVQLATAEKVAEQSF